MRILENIDDFNKFLKKYNKTGYVSKNSIKKLDSSDMKFNHFQELQNQISEYINFFNNGELEILLDMFLDLYDKYPINSNKTQIEYELEVTLDYEYRKYSNEDNRIIISDNHYKYDIQSPNVPNKVIYNTQNILQLITDNIENQRNSKIKEIESDIKNPIQKSQYYRQGVTDKENKNKLNKVINGNPFKNMRIVPNIKLEFYFDWENSNDGWIDIEYRSDRHNEISQTIRNCELDLKEIMERYFMYLGYPGLKASIYREHNSGQGSPYIRFRSIISSF